MPKIKFEVTDTPSGAVIVNVDGDIKASDSNAAFVARGMAVYANALFVASQQVQVVSPAGVPVVGFGDGIGLMRGQWGGDSYE